MKKAFFLIFLSVVCSLAFAEQITITTYYPAPYGVYKELKTKRIVIGNDRMPTQDAIINFQPRGIPVFRDAGALYYNSAAREFRYWDGSRWQRIATVYGTQCIRRRFTSATGSVQCPAGYAITQSSLSSGSIAGLWPRNNVTSGYYLCCPYR